MKEPIQQLFTKYLAEECTSDEIETLMVYFNLPENELLTRQLIKNQITSGDDDQDEQPGLDDHLDMVYTKVQQYINNDKAHKTKLRRRWLSVAAAAAILLFIGAGVMFYKPDTPVVLVVNSIKNIKPGKSSATLTLANGSKILLSDAANGVLAKQTGISIIKTRGGKIIYQMPGAAPLIPARSTEIAYNTLSTARGEQYTIVLPDESTVTLNAASSIKYPASFANLKERKIELTGKAYFAVKHNSRQPFRVIAKGQVVEDIGTAFNINSYADEPDVKTTLLSGLARVSAAGNEAVTLSPAQQTVLTGASLKITGVDPAIFIAWMTGTFAYKNTSLQEVMRQVARWYNVEVDYQSADLKLKRLSGSVSRYDNVTGILNAIGYTAKVKFKIENRTITVLQGD